MIVKMGAENVVLCRCAFEKAARVEMDGCTRCTQFRRHLQLVDTTAV